MSDTQTQPKRQATGVPRRLNAFFLIVLAMHIPLFIYPILRLGHWLQAPWWLILLILVPIASSQTVVRVYLRNRREHWAVALRHIADFFMGLSPLILFPLLLAELVVMAGLIAPMNAAMAVLVVGFGAATTGIIAALTPFVRTVSLASPHITRPLRFVQITDVHIGSRSRQFLEGIVARINRLDPEFVCITGDFIDATGVPESDLRSLKSISGPIYFSLGNHEKYEDLDDILRRLNNVGVNVLRDRAMPHNDELQIIGIDDMEDALQVERQLAHIELAQSGYKILLYHRPRGLKAAAKAGIDLMLSGHTHNGQIFPFNLVVNRVFDKTCGLYKEGQSHLYVSQGTGTWGPVMRVGTRAEITLFEIKPSKETSDVH